MHNTGIAARTLGSDPIHNAIIERIKEDQYDAVYLLNLHESFSIRLIPRIRSHYDGPILFQYNDNDAFCVRKYNYIDEQRRCCRDCISDPESAVRNHCWKSHGYEYFAASMANRRDGYYRLAMDAIDAFLITSDGSRELLKTLGTDKNRIVSIHNPMNVTDFTPEPVGKHLVYYGLPILTKGIEILVRALSIANIEEFHGYFLFNNPPVFEALERIASQRGIQVQLHHDITWQNGLFDRVGSARAVIVPSQWDTPCEMSISESVSMGRALITSDYSSRTPLVQPGKNALVFPANDHVALANALTELSKDVKKAEIMGKASRTIAESLLTPDIWYETFLEAVARKRSSNKSIPKAQNIIIDSSTAGISFPNIDQLRSGLFNDALSALEHRQINGEKIFVESDKIVSPDQLYGNAQQLIAKSRDEEAIASLNELLDTFPEYGLAHNDLGVLYFNDGDKNNALRHYQIATRLAPENVVFLKNLADFYYVEQGRMKEALEIYLKILTDDPTDIETLTILGHICGSLNKFDDAKVFYDKVLEIEPWNMDAKEKLDELGTRIDDSLIGGFDDSGRDGGRRTEDGDQESEVGGQRSEISGQGGSDGWMSTNHRMIELSNQRGGIGSPDELYKTAQGFMEGGREKEAIGALKVFLAVYPDYALAHNDLGVLYYNEGEKEKALKHYEQAAQLKPNNLTFQKNLADFYYFELERIEEALKIYNGILTENPEDLETLLVVGHICIKLDKIDDAIDFYNRVLEIDSGNANAIEMLRQVRKTVAQFFLDKSQKDLSEHYTREYSSTHRKILAGNLKDYPLSEDEQGFLDAFAAKTNSVEKSPKAMPSLLASMLYYYPHQLPIEFDLLEMPEWLQEGYCAFLLSLSTLFHKTRGGGRLLPLY